MEQVTLNRHAQESEDAIYVSDHATVKRSTIERNRNRSANGWGLTTVRYLNPECSDELKDADGDVLFLGRAQAEKN